MIVSYKKVLAIRRAFSGEITYKLDEIQIYTNVRMISAFFHFRK